MEEKKKILEVDDEEALCDGLGFNLEAEGYHVDMAYSAEEALARDLAGYDLILLDIMMGGNIRHPACTHYEIESGDSLGSHNILHSQRHGRGYDCRSRPRGRRLYRDIQLMASNALRENG